MTDTNKHSGDSDELWFPEDDLLQETDSFFDESPSGKSADGKHSGRNRSASGRSASKGGNKRSPSGRSRGANRNRKHSSSRKKGGKRRSRETYLHLAIAGVLLVMFLVAAIRLIIWNIGEDSGFDPNADTSEFDQRHWIMCSSWILPSWRDTKMTASPISSALETPPLPTTVRITGWPG